MGGTTAVRYRRMRAGIYFVLSNTSPLERLRQVCLAQLSRRLRICRSGRCDAGACAKCQLAELCGMVERLGESCFAVR